jgi:Domain of unknown function (DUF4386)
VKAHRTTAAIVGVLYIIGTVAGVLSMIVTAGILDGSDHLARLASHENQARWGALLTLVMGVALAMVPAMMFPVLRRQNEALAVGYVIFRGALETATYLGVAMCWLLLVVDGRQYADAATEAAPRFASLATLVVKGMDPLIAIQGIVFSLGALMFYSLLYRARILPRWISGWGLLAVVAYLIAGVIALFGPSLVILLMPLAVQEMVMAVWLITKGFGPGAVAPRSDRQPLAA